MLDSLLSPIYITSLDLMGSDTIPVQFHHLQARPVPRPPAATYPAAHPSPPLDYTRHLTLHMAQTAAVIHLLLPTPALPHLG